jgi:hypothetical protein
MIAQWGASGKSLGNVLGDFSLHIGGERLPQKQMRPMQAGFGRADREPEHRRNLLVRQTFDLGQQIQGAIQSG